MAIFENVNDTIEGQKVDCTTRRFERKGLKRHPVYQKIMFLFSCDRNSSALIKEKMADTHMPPEGASCYHRNEGDELKCDAMSVYVNQIKPVVPIVKEGVTGRHGASKIHTTKHTIASIRVPLQNVLTRLGLGSQGKIEKK